MITAIVLGVQTFRSFTVVQWQRENIQDDIDYGDQSDKTDKFWFHLAQN